MSTGFFDVTSVSQYVAAVCLPLITCIVRPSFHTSGPYFKNVCKLEALILIKNEKFHDTKCYHLPNERMEKESQTKVVMICNI